MNTPFNFLRNKKWHTGVYYSLVILRVSSVNLIYHRHTFLLWWWPVTTGLSVLRKFGELWSPARQQIWPWSRSKVKAKITTWCQWKGPVTTIMYAKYQCSIINTYEDMSQVKVFVTNRGTDGRRDGRTDGQMRFNVPPPPAFAKGGGQKREGVASAVGLILKNKPRLVSVDLRGVDNQVIL